MADFDTYAVYADFSCVSSDDEELCRKAIEPHIGEGQAKLRAESVYGRAILKYMLRRCYGVTDFEVAVGENGKPYIKNSNLYFNLSHSEKMVMCAVSSDETGCDVQLIKPYKENVAKRFFTKDEYALLCKTENTDEVFTRLWALKEAILKQKAVGIGGISEYGFSEKLFCNSFSAYGLCFSCFKKDNYCYGICSCSESISVSGVDANEIIGSLI